MIARDIYQQDHATRGEPFIHGPSFLWKGFFGILYLIGQLIYVSQIVVCMLIPMDTCLIRIMPFNAKAPIPKYFRIQRDLLEVFYKENVKLYLFDRMLICALQVVVFYFIYKLCQLVDWGKYLILLLSAIFILIYIDQ